MKLAVNLFALISERFEMSRGNLPESVTEVTSLQSGTPRQKRKCQPWDLCITPYLSHLWRDAQLQAAWTCRGSHVQTARNTPTRCQTIAFISLHNTIILHTQGGTAASVICNDARNLAIPRPRVRDPLRYPTPEVRNMNQNDK